MRHENYWGSRWTTTHPYWWHIRLTYPGDHVSGVLSFPHFAACGTFYLKLICSGKYKILWKIKIVRLALFDLWFCWSGDRNCEFVPSNLGEKQISLTKYSFQSNQFYLRPIYKGCLEHIVNYPIFFYLWCICRALWFVKIRIILQMQWMFIGPSIFFWFFSHNATYDDTSQTNADRMYLVLMWRNADKLEQLTFFTESSWKAYESSKIFKHLKHAFKRIMQFHPFRRSKISGDREYFERQSKMWAFVGVLCILKSN